MKKLNIIDVYKANPLWVNFSNPVKRAEFINSQVKENNSYPLIKGARIDDLEIKVNIINHTAESENLNMFLFCDDGTCFSKPIYIGKDSTSHAFFIRDENTDFFEGKEFNKIGFTSNKGEVIFSFEVIEYSTEDEAIFL